MNKTFIDTTTTHKERRDIFSELIILLNKIHIQTICTHICIQSGSGAIALGC